MPVDTGTFPDGSELAPSERARRLGERWAAAQAAGTRVLVLGAATPPDEPPWAGVGQELVSVTRGPELSVIVRRRGSGGNAEVSTYPPLAPGQSLDLERLVSEEAFVLNAGGGFDSLIFAGELADHPRPDALLEAALRLGRKGAQVIAVLPYGPPVQGATSRCWGLAEFTDLVRPYLSPRDLLVSEGSIRFTGLLDTGKASAWERYSPEALLQLSERAGFVALTDARQQIEALGHTLRRLRWSARYQVGSALVRAAQNPSLLAGLPAALWKIYRSRRRAARSETERGQAPGTAAIPAYPVPAANPPVRPLVAAVLDVFSSYCLRYDANLLLLSRKRWRSEIEREKPDLLLVESAWHGNGGDWSYQVADAAGQPNGALADLVSYCRQRGIPTAFWNKEDPRGFEEFLPAAKAFDLVFTTDELSIPRYREACGHERIYPLPFAAQPSIHNPRRDAAWPRHRVCFAGSWVGSKYPQRSQELEWLLDSAREFGLTIFDRNHAQQDDRLRFPAKYDGLVQGALDYDRMLTAYRTCDVMLNTNSVTESPTMFSRRVFESLACGTPVVSTPSAGMERMLGDHVRTAGRPGAAREHLSALLASEESRSRAGHLAYRHVHMHHTYRHRLAEVYRQAGLIAPAEWEWPRVSVIIATHRPRQIDHALANYARQNYARKDLTLVLNNAEFDVKDVKARAARTGGVTVLPISGETSLGGCLNEAIDRTNGAWLAKMDDDDWYGEHYLSDAVLAARFSNADIVGKGMYFTFMEGRNELALRELSPEHEFADVVSGATLLVRRQVFDRIRFRRLPRGTDTAFLEDASAGGLRIYSGDRYNFVLVRRAGGRDHTWRIGDAELSHLCRHVSWGFESGRVMM